MSTAERSLSLNSHLSDIVDIKPANMEELTEVITSAEFHPQQCHTFAYSSSKGSIRLCDMRQAALCDKHCKCEYLMYPRASWGNDSRRMDVFSFVSRLMNSPL